jgi:hypothetical protein
MRRPRPTRGLSRKERQRERERERERERKGKLVLLSLLSPPRALIYLFVSFWHNSLQRVRASSITRFLDHTQRRTKGGRTPRDEWWARCRDLYLTTHNTHNRLTSMPPAGFEATISAGERSQTYALDWRPLRSAFPLYLLPWNGLSGCLC